MVQWQGVPKTIGTILALTAAAKLVGGGLQRLVGQGLGDAVDTADCYFDKECHAQVDWDRISELKGEFFLHLGLLKNHGKTPVPDQKALETLLLRMHGLFVKAGMPDDRIDFILHKWVNSVYPNSLDMKMVNTGKPDCYFDKECHAKVDWETIATLKEGFFKRLKMMKTRLVDNSGGSDKSGSSMEPLESMLARMHEEFAKAGMPDDRIDYILGKWVDFAYPAAFDTTETPNVVIQGFACENGYGKEVNQEYEYQGVTAAGRPYYKGLADDSKFLYHDMHCSEDNSWPAWILGGQPSLTLLTGLNERDGKGCENDFNIASESRHVPLGHQATAWAFCGDHGYANQMYVSVGYKFAAATTKTEKEQREPTVVADAAESDLKASVVV
eukprot:TRINITY_DN23834_c1_g4_i1.p1 TRINITY_DN23834_c1_g4~~TRINITY_DN23834_c1_g4_i1.p1  ORF type:complete len:385 (+),score=94.46 TRINITY_DN23834_c1_g4_i1:135-1289(+)